MLFEPAFRLPERGAEPRHFIPEAAGVVHLLEVREFVQDEVVLNERRGLNQAPVKGNGATSRAGAPAGTLVAHHHPLYRQLVQRSQFEHPRGQFLLRQTPKVVLDGGPEVTSRIRDRHDFAAKLNQAGLAVCPG